MNLEILLQMKDDELKQEYAKARRASDLENITLINTIRIKNWIMIAFQLFPDEKDTFIYYESNGQNYFYPKYKEFIPKTTNYVEWQMIAHMNGRTPIPVDINLLQNLLATDRISFAKSTEKIDIPIMENILNYNYETEDVQEVKLPDIWVPNGKEELEIAVADMPKQDKEAILLTNVTSYLTIGNYKTSNKTFTDVFYSPIQAGDTPKAIILNDIAGIKGNQLEEELHRQSVFYSKKANTILQQKNTQNDNKTLINLDLSTIWTAKFIEIIEDAIKDSQEQEDFVPTVAKIYNVSSKIVTTLESNGQPLSLNVTYNTLIIFDGKLILYETTPKNLGIQEVIALFNKHGLSAQFVEEPINLLPFIKGRTKKRGRPRK